MHACRGAVHGGGSDGAAKEACYTVRRVLLHVAGDWVVHEHVIMVLAGWQC